MYYQSLPGWRVEHWRVQAAIYLLTYTRLGLKCLTVTNTLAYTQEERDKSQCLKSLTAAHQSGVLLKSIRLGEKCLTHFTLAL